MILLINDFFFHYIHSNAFCTLLSVLCQMYNYVNRNDAESGYLK